jgi:glycosyltransferase involved in cell wall biosynthesis
MEYSNIYENNIILICMKINVLLKFLLIIFIINFLYLSFNYPKKKILHLQTKTRIKQLIEGEKYIKICLKGLLINKNFEKKKRPKISVIIPVYNCEKSIIPSIRSIQNQQFLGIEIIIVNDFSKDNSSFVIEKLKKKDSRIKIINNNKNMGTLYSRCIGVINAKGKYIFSLDHDDLFFNYDIFKFIYNVANDGNFDIISFKSIYIDNYRDNISKMYDSPFSHHPNNLILFQPELSNYPINKKQLYNDIHIWAKCIKKEVYKKAVNLLGKKRYSVFMSWAEDTSMIFIIFNIAKSFKFVDKYGVIHLNANITSSFTQPKNKKIFGEIYLLDIIFDFSKNNSNKNLAVDYALFLKSHYKYNKFKKDRNYNYLNLILQKIINCKFINKLNKLKIKNKFKDFFNL